MIDLKAFDRLPLPWQNPGEWLAFLQFCDGYFSSRGITRPLVVELGVYENRQRPYYIELLGAEHIGIDIKNEFTEPDIVGDTRSGLTVEALKTGLAGRNADLLFIDADHEYESVQLDYEIYSVFVGRGLVAFHDIYSYPNSVGKFWRELVETAQDRKDRTFLEFKSWNGPASAQGIGVIIKEE